METYFVHPDKSQEKALRAFLKALAVPYEKKKDEPLPDHVVKGIKRGQDQLKSGLGKTTQEVFRKYENL
ncbi:DUF2683 family protein [Pedobacter foliorum]|uniref:DUF2683 family protein n=1 Tax=Pedobacter foliorum TaxID=2739058 RepID=UPI0015654EC7|nr:DUF2683 family protein [Pedobacter foliorum]NRF41190.1 hypothetical protein [Pedobacter foliorum]